MGLNHAWGGEEDTYAHADYVRGGVPLDDFEKEVNYKKKIGKKPKPKKQRGCPENDFGPHVYVWVPMAMTYDWWPDHRDNFYERHGFHRREYKVCCGCEKRQGSRYTEQFQKLISRKGWYNANYG